MLRSAPSFWERDGLLPTLLVPLGWAYGAVGARRRAAIRPWRAPVPVFCVGNLVAGGAGKTPVALDLARRLIARGATPHLLTRGYGGKLPGPVQVDPARHGFRDVGDEALLLAEAAPTWVARDRAAGAQAAVAAAAGALILDDGFQNPSLVQDFRLLVVDGAYGFGNGRVIPAGPLREPIAAGLARADAIVLMGEGRGNVATSLSQKLILRATLQPSPAAPNVAGLRLLAFAGIGQPEKFFALLESLGAHLVARRGFADHHRFSEAELRRLLREAESVSATAITTEKDAVRVPPTLRDRIRTLPVEVRWEAPAALDALLDRALAGEVCHG